MNMRWFYVGGNGFPTDRVSNPIKREELEELYALASKDYDGYASRLIQRKNGSVVAHTMSIGHDGIAVAEFYGRNVHGIPAPINTDWISLLYDPR